MHSLIEPKLSLEHSIEEVKANRLKKFQLKSHSLISDEKANELGIALSTNTSLKFFSLSSIQLSDTAAQSIAQGLAHHPSLDMLVLAGRKISVQGIYLFIDILPTLHKLTWLTLCETTLGNEGIERLGRVIPSCGSIKHFALKDNQITDEGVQNFMGYVKPIKRFIYIDIGRNNLSNASLAIVKQAMLDNFALRILICYSKLAEEEYEIQVNSYANLNFKLKGSVRKAAARILSAARLLYGISQKDSQTLAIPLPAIIRKKILGYLDSDDVLSTTQISNIYEYARDRDILKKHHKEVDFLEQVSCDRPKQHAERVSFFNKDRGVILLETSVSSTEKRKASSGEIDLPQEALPSKRANITLT